jgi:hypothetical protein
MHKHLGRPPGVPPERYLGRERPGRGRGPQDRTRQASPLPSLAHLGQAQVTSRWPSTDRRLLPHQRRSRRQAHETRRRPRAQAGHRPHRRPPRHLRVPTGQPASGKTSSSPLPPPLPATLTPSTPSTPHASRSLFSAPLLNYISGNAHFGLLALSLFFILTESFPRYPGI